MYIYVSVSICLSSKLLAMQMYPSWSALFNFKWGGERESGGIHMLYLECISI